MKDRGEHWVANRTEWVRMILGILRRWELNLPGPVVASNEEDDHDTKARVSP